MSGDSEYQLYHRSCRPPATFVGYVYYGKRVRGQDLRYLLRTGEAPFVPSENERERCSFYDTFPSEYSGNGVGDYRESSIAVRTQDGQHAVMPTYVSYEITDQKPELPGLPSAFDRENTAQTLILHCRDEVLQLDVDLYYTVFEENDMITRSVRICNHSKEAVYLTKAYSACMDMDDDAYEMLTLHGSWGERAPDGSPSAGIWKDQRGKYPRGVFPSGTPVYGMDEIIHYTDRRRSICHAFYLFRQFYCAAGKEPV